MNKYVKYIAFFVLVSLLVIIRIFEEQLFYDPYLAFFKNDYLYIDSPRQEVFKLASNTALRYVLNSIISLGILFVLFKDKSIIKFSILIYTIAFLTFMSLFLYFVIHPKKEDYYLFFNVRRFLIQPLIALLLIPAFYYHKQRL
ncbi:exosortase F system-associated membrane protein [Xanthomarina sp. GH4-25]|uniref:exosortase F system-associated membrane protein n=1 Tax=Xanthomarina sp. GH4-25 TaxID=3349335 RepID=UPI000D67C017|nr:exosortase F system-associated protein [Flavobacteriaceae bacterium LYZ1037]